MTVHSKMYDGNAYVSEDKPTVMVSGGFDPVHAGHIRMIGYIGKRVLYL